MIHLFTLVLLSFNVSSYAASRTLFCSGSFNSESIFESEVVLKEKEKVPYGKLGGLEFFVTDKGRNQIELEVFNTYEPSRSYAVSTLDTEDSFVELVIWKQDYLLETRCSQVSMTKRP